MKITPENVGFQLGHEPAAADAVIDTSAWCDLKDCDGVLIKVTHFRGGDDDITFDIHEGDAASGVTAIAENAKIWYVASALTDPTPVRQTDAKNFEINTGVDTGTGYVFFYLDAAACKRYVQLGVSDPGHGSSIMSVDYMKSQTRYKGNESY